MIWWIVLAALVLLALLPVGVTARYAQGQFSVKLLAGPVRIHLYPGRGEKTGKKEKKKTTKRANKEQKPADTQEKNVGIRSYLPLLKLLLRFCDQLRRKLRVKNLILHITLAGDDPCDLAVNYGRANAAMGNLLPRLERVLKIRKRDIQIQCDFEAEKTNIYGRIDAKLSLGRLLWLVLRHGLQVIKHFITMKNNKEGGASQ